MGRIGEITAGLRKCSSADPGMGLESQPSAHWIGASSRHTTKATSIAKTQIWLKGVSYK